MFVDEGTGKTKHPKLAVIAPFFEQISEKFLFIYII